MKIRQKSIVASAATLVVMLVGLIFVAEPAVIQGYRELQHESSERDARRAVAALDAVARELDVVAMDWGQWDDTYRFVEERDPEYISSNMTDAAIKDTLKLDAVLILNASGDVLYSSDPRMSAAGYAYSSQVRKAAESETVRHRGGLLRLGKRSIVLGASPILRSDRSGPSRGTIIMLRDIDGDKIVLLEERTQLQLSILDPDATHGRGHRLDRRRLLGGDPQVFIGEDDGHAHTMTLLLDTSGEPAFIIASDVPADIVIQGKKIAPAFIAVTIAGGVASVVLGLLLAQVLIVTRLKRLDSEVSAIQPRLHSTSSSDLGRVSESGVDEISSLARSINHTLGALEAAMAGEREAREELTSTKERYESLVVSSGDGICLLSEGTIVFVNPSFLAISGLSADDAVGRSLKTIINTAAGSLWEPGGAVEGEIERPDGEPLRVEVNFSNASLEGVEYLMVTVRDLTARIEAEEARRAADEREEHVKRLESLGLLAGGIAHDFNNLLGSIFGYIDLARYSQDSGEAASFLTAAMSSMDRAKSLSTRLLTFSTGGQPVRSKAPLHPFVQESVEFALSGSNVAPYFKISTPRTWIDYDAGQIGQIIDNIVFNACESMPDGGTLRVVADEVKASDSGETGLHAGQYARVIFEDSGPGVSSEVAERIFDPFFTTKSLGYGLGLPTALSIARRHGGDLRLSQSSGIGARFELYLPTVEPLATPKKVQDSGLPQGGPSHWDASAKGWILVMDDEPTIREVMRLTLGRRGFVVDVAAHGEKALEMYEDSLRAGEPYCAIFLDLTVPGHMGGKQTMASLLEAGCKVPVFVASGYSDDPVMADPTAFGFTASIRKPFSAEELSALLKLHLDSE